MLLQATADILAPKAPLAVLCQHTHAGEDMLQEHITVTAAVHNYDPVQITAATQDLKDIVTRAP